MDTIGGYHRHTNRAYFAMMRVLLVDDCRDILFLLRTELEWMGYQVHSAADARTAVEIAEDLLPDVIVSDLRCPDSTASNSSSGSGKAPG